MDGGKDKGVEVIKFSSRDIGSEEFTSLIQCVPKLLSRSEHLH